MGEKELWLRNQEPWVLVSDLPVVSCVVFYSGGLGFFPYESQQGGWITHGP